ncbi:MAG: Uncharacterized MFS-type transporter [uncultured Caballeronia sp.]|nr:MAG: Uncharacterized MFS-type transporter [uncultured Caballeronia sp.]
MSPTLYYAQPITELIAPDIHMSVGTASLIVSLTQIGYAFGLFFLVPLGDLLENRKLMITTAIISIFSLALASVTHQPNAFLAVSLLVGFSSVAVQILIPLAAHLAPDESRGRVVVTGVVLDFAVQMNMVLGQREIYALHAASRNRLNALYMTSIFIGGAIGPALANSLYEQGGCTLTATVASVFPLIALVHYLAVGRSVTMATA